MDSRGKAIPFIQSNKDGRMSISPEAADMLKSVSGPLAVVAVVGTYRSGKSFVLNQLLGRQSGFDIGPTVNACTKGLWIWSEPMAVESGGEEMNVLLLDTEGLGSFDGDDQHDVKIFSLALLLSSYFIYNSMKYIDEAAIERLSFVAELSKHIRLTSSPPFFASPSRTKSPPSSMRSPSTSPRTIPKPSSSLSPRLAGKSGPSEDDPRAMASFFPSFLWLVRDFTLTLTSPDGAPISSRQYLETALEPRRGDAEKTRAKNRIRSALREYFVDRDCVTLVQPVHKEEKLQDLGSVEPHELRSEFVVGMEDLREKIIGKLSPKRVSGHAIRGSMLLSLAEKYVDAMNDGSVPTISTAWDAVVTAENREALDKAMHFFKTESRGLMNAKEVMMGEQELLSWMSTCEKTAWGIFHDNAIGEQKMIQEERLREFMEEEFKLVKGEMDHRSSSQCEVVAKDKLQWVVSRIKNGDVESADDFRKSVEKALDSYRSEAKGSFRTSMLTNLLQSMMREPLQELLNVVAASQRAEYDTQVAELHSEIHTRKTQAKAVAAKYEDCYARLHKAVSEMKSRAKMIIKYEHAVKECKIKEVSLTEEVTSLQTKLQESEEQLTSEKEVNAQLQTNLETISREIAEKDAFIERVTEQFRVFQSDSATIRERLEAERDRSTTLQTQLDETKADADRLHAELEHAKHEKSIAEASSAKHLGALEEQLKLKELALSNLTDEVNSLQDTLHQRMEHCAALEEGKKKQRAEFQQQMKEYDIKFERANNLIKELEQRAKNAEEKEMMLKKEFDAAMTRLGEVGDSLDDLGRENEKLQANLDAKQEERKEMMEQIRILTKQIEERKESEGRVVLELEAKTHEIVMKSQKLEHLESTMAIVSKENEKTLEAIKKEKKAADERGKKLEQRVESLRFRLEDLENETRQLTSSLEYSERARSDAVGQMSALQKTADQRLSYIRDYEKEVASLRTEVKNLEKARGEDHRREEELEETVARLREICDRSEEDSEARRRRESERISVLESRLNETALLLKKRTLELEESDHRVSSLKRSAEEKEARISELSDHLAEREAESKVMSEELDALRLKIRDRDAYASHLFEEKKTADMKISSIMHAAENLREEMHDSEYRRLSAAFDKSSRTSGMVGSERSRLSYGSSKMTPSAEELLQEIDALHEMNRRTLAINRHVIEENTILRGEIDTLPQDEIDETSRRLSSQSLAKEMTRERVSLTGDLDETDVPPDYHRAFQSRAVRRDERIPSTSSSSHAASSEKRTGPSKSKRKDLDEELDDDTWEKYVISRDFEQGADR